MLSHEWADLVLAAPPLDSKTLSLCPDTEEGTRPPLLLSLLPKCLFISFSISASANFISLSTLKSKGEDDEYENSGAGGIIGRISEPPSTHPSTPPSIFLGFDARPVFEAKATRTSSAVRLLDSLMERTLAVSQKLNLFALTHALRFSKSIPNSKFRFGRGRGVEAGGHGRRRSQTHWSENWAR